VEPEPLPDPVRDYEPIRPGTDWRGLFRKIWAPVAAAIGVLVKFSFVFFKFATIFIAIGGYALIWGWRFGVGLVLLIFVHEMGHFIEAKRQGLDPGWPVFVPFFGAFVTIRGARISPWQNALVSLAGPFTGGLGAAAVWAAGEANGSRLLQALGYFGFLLNLINLAPLGFLDGGQISRSIGYLRRGGAPYRARMITVAYVGLAVALAIGMYGAHVAQHRL
jgi:membrane-associated protease RseP (regulator of RpoE activity)